MSNPTKVMIYDDSCPMCQAYTKGFVQAGILPEGGRQCFSEVPADIRAKLDLDKGRHEIPLYDTVTGETIYGKQALFFLLSSRWTWLKPIFENALVQAVVHQAYQIVTYNRRLIAGSRPPKAGFDCAPDFNAFYRTIYIVLAVVASVVLSLFIAGFDAAHTLQLWIAPVLVAVVAQIALSNTLKRMDFLGHWATVTLLSQIFLLPFLWITLPFNFVIAIGAAVFLPLMYQRWKVIKATNQ